MRKFHVSLASLATSIVFLSLLGLAACDGVDALPFGDASGGADTGGACTPACDGRVCGDDGCGGTCGPGCGVTQQCSPAGQCVPRSCTPDCAARECGDDGCGGTCGTCGAGLRCGAAGVCAPEDCTPSCDGRACGSDGCGGLCGTCAAGTSCTAAGQCVPGGCQPACAGRECGDDGCGGSCGACAGGEACEDGACVSAVCVPQCAGRECGPDPVCGQNCGTCRAGDVCRAGACECQPDCAGRICGDDGCGGSCGTCGAGETCNARGACIDPACVPDCDGVQCGPDPVCGQSCGGCTNGLACVENVCACVPSCVGTACGSDGCGGSCGSCSAGLTCLEGMCVCVPSCAGRQCGSDGCGGSCGTCGAGQTCQAGQCQSSTCTPSCTGRQCGDNGCGGSCGTCAAGQTCTAAGQCQGGGTGPRVDTPCTADADCGAGGTCLDFGGYFPGGYCSVACSDAAPCPEGSECWNLGAEVGSYCLHMCTASSECRAGYWCDTDSTCWPGEAPQPGTGLVGTPCATDADCGGGTCYPERIDGEPTGFVGGYCLVFDCSETVACPAGSECWGLQDGGTVCLDSCTRTSDCRAGYACDDQACLPSCTADSCPAGYVCNATSGLCEEEPCTSDGDCPNGLVCTSGACVAEIGEGPRAGPGPTCANLPPLECAGTAAYCGEIVPFEPKTGDGWDDYPLNGETAQNQYRSYIRRDVMIAVKYAAAKTRCKLGPWAYGNGDKPIGLGDMSEANGAIPGTSVGQPGHPEGTHTNGFDMDLGYYQVGTADNRLRPICAHTTNGQEQYHCTAAPHLLDPWRTAFFLAALAEHPQIRVIGVDGQAGPLIDAALTRLCQDGWTASVANCANPSWYDFPVTYETTNGGAGWYYFHHHHFHISFSARANKSTLAEPAWCLTPECQDVSVLPEPRFDLRATDRLRRVTRAGLIRL